MNSRAADEIFVGGKRRVEARRKKKENRKKAKDVQRRESRDKSLLL